MPRKAFVADVGVISSQISSGALPHVKSIQLDSSDDIVTVELLCKGLALPVVLSIICGDIDTYPDSAAYFLSAENVPDGYEQAVTGAQSATSIRTLLDIIQQVNMAILRLQNKSRTGKQATEDDAIIICDSSSDDCYNGAGKGLRKNLKRSAPSAGRVDRNASPRLAGQSSAGQRSTANDDGYDGDLDKASQPANLAALSSKTKISQNPRSATPKRGAKTSSVTASGSAGGAYAASDDEFAFDYNDIYDAALLDYEEDNSISYYNTMGKPHPRQERIAEDLKAVRQQGYYFGVLSGMNETSTENLLSISIRTSDLGLSPQMLLAWDLDPEMFIVLLIRLNSRYQGYKSLLNMSPSDADLSFRIGKCSTYKPFVDDAVAAFESQKSEWKNPLPGKTGASFSKILISKSLATFMNQHFLEVARLREDFKCSWANAVEAVVNRSTMTRSEAESLYSSNREAGVGDPSHKDQSFPLMAMQFAMDQLTNCTVYCQACHKQVEKRHQSLKPTVCSADLCLYQHMNLGLGRSAEYEILCQPNVVDLLINFCYAALLSSLTSAIDPVRTYPTQLPLKIADWSNPRSGVYSHALGNRTSFIVSPTLSGDPSIHRYRPGQWVVVVLGCLAAHDSAGTLQASSYVPARSQTPFPRSALRHAVVTGVDEANSTVYLHHFYKLYSDAHNSPAEIFRYTKDLDDIAPEHKASQLLVLLDTLPPVEHLKAELEKPSVADLKSVSGVSPAAAVLLGWIVATNRSCIMQIQEPKMMVKETLAQYGGAPKPLNELLQFCFLQGVPEADYEFQQQLVKAENPAHPTLLAWHGSQIENWHSILRSGLDFSVVTNGRAFGNGVYFSHDYKVSKPYSRLMTQGTQWPNAVLDLQSVISLNEIINAPSQFASCTPHYVVQHKNWSRCRFLFAKPGATATSMSMQPPVPTPFATAPIPALAPAPAPALAPQRQRSSVLSTMFDSSVYMRPKDKHAASFTTIQGVPPPAVPTIPPPTAPTQSSAHSLATRAQSSIHRWQSAQSGRDEVFQQDSKRLVRGPTGGFIVIPAASMPASANMLGINKHQPKRVKVGPAAAITMDVSDLSFLSKGVHNLLLQNKKQGHAPTNRRKPTAGTKIPDRAVVIDLLSDSDEPMTMASGPKVTSTTAPVASALAPAPAPARLNVTPFRPGTLDYSTLPQLPLPSWCTANAQRALAREMDRMQKVQQNTPLAELGWYIDFARMENMFQWIVELHSFDLTLPLASDMMNLGVRSIVCELRFGADYPMSPPLVRIIRPRFLPFLQGGGGNVTAGGAMCMELLTSTGWSPANQTDAVLLQVRLAICAVDRPALLDRRSYKRDYGVGEAFEAYRRAAATHGWQVPKDMQQRMTL